MKVLFIISDLGFGGAERTVSYLSSYLIDKGEEVTIYMMNNRICYNINPKVKIICGDFSEHGKSNLKRKVNSIWRFVAINQAVRKEKPDIVFCIMADHAKYLMLDFNKRYKLIVSERSNPKFISKKEYWLRKRIIKSSDGIIFQTRRVTENYKGLVKGKGVIIPNAVGNELISQMQISWNIECRNSIVAVGRLDSSKDYFTLIKAFQLFYETHSNYILEIYGEGCDREKLEKYIEKKHLKNIIFLKGTCADAIVKISDASCYILTSVFEGMPNSLMEAMGIGMPCIATDCEYGPSELIKNNWNGLLVPVKDVKAISNALSKMTDDREFAIKCGKNAKEILKTNSVESVCSRYRKFFYHVLQGR